MTFTVRAQIIDCDYYFKNFDSREPTELVHVYYECKPLPIGGFEKFYKKVEVELRKEPVGVGKVFVWFIVDTTGRVQCARVVKAENEQLNDRAIHLIKETEFVPAERRGRKVVAQMVLPITFGEPQKKSKRR